MPMPDKSGSSFVFLDPYGKRWSRLRLLCLAVGLVSFLGVVLFVQSLFVTPHIHPPSSIQNLKARLRALQKRDVKAAPAAPIPLWLAYSKAANAAAPPKGGALPPASRAGADREREIRLGFYVSWDPYSLYSLKAHAGELTHVCPEWMTVVDGEGTLAVEPDPRVLGLAEDEGVVVLPLLNNLVGDVWQPEAVEGLANGPAARRERFIDNVLARLGEASAGGVVIDWGGVDPAYRDGVTSVLKDLAAALHREQKELWLCIPVGTELKVFDLDALYPCVDRFVAMLHDENSENDTPGPIASQEWYEGWLRSLTGYGRPSQWVIAIGAFGYDWAKGGEKADWVSFTDAMTRAGRAGLKACAVQAPLYNPSFSYEDSGVEHTVWFLDAVTFLNQVQAARSQTVAGFAISRLGTEDPTLWAALRQARSSPGDLAALQNLPSAEIVAHVGKGEFLTVEGAHADGYRAVLPDPAGRLAAQYERFPIYVTVGHQGQGRPDEVAISFDDGPDPKWTPMILDILKSRGVKAAFFLVGDKMEESPGLVKRIVREGHEIGVHTYTHPNLATVSRERAILELNATQRLIGDTTGRSTILFRPPYDADSRPHDRSEIAGIEVAQGLGYLTMTVGIDPKDWSRPGVDAIVQAVRQSRPYGNVILLHDGGGDRRQTARALPRIIDYLEERGDRIVPLGQLLGSSPELLMPPLSKDQESITRLVSGSGFRVLRFTEGFLFAFMIVATVLVVARTLVIVLLAASGRRARDEGGARFSPPVSVLIAAYNEERVIAGTLRALLESRYSGEMEVLVVDDGSTDRTTWIVEAAARRDRRLRLLRQGNMGKASALKNGLRHVQHDVVVTLDADTHFRPETISRLVQPLRDPRVGGVSGHAKVGNLRTFIARCQALEYTCGFNLDRRAYERLDCITVIPGAVSALRMSAVNRAGGISGDTLAEDTDLTLSLHRYGFKIAYVPEAVAWTEAPETISDLAKQRFRWAFGTMQCLWKHRDLIFNPKKKSLGWLSLPSICFFQMPLVAATPLVDAMVLFSILFWTNSTVFLYLIVFLLMDLLLACLACYKEREPLRNAWLVVPMRFVYRPLLAWVMWKALLKALKGAFVGWGKVERTASIPARPSEDAARG